MKWHTSGQFPSLVLLFPSHGYKQVSSLRDVAEALMLCWPTDDGEEYVTAVKICLEAILGNMPPQESRAALVRAAEEIGIPILTVVCNESSSSLRSMKLKSGHVEMR